MSLVIGPQRIADSRGTYEPGDVIEFPTDALQALADSKATDPESGKLYCKSASAATVAAAMAATPPAPADPVTTPVSPEPEKP